MAIIFRTAILRLALALAIVGIVSVAAADSVAPGDTVAAFTLPGADGASYGLDQYSDSAAVVVMFIATQCPVSNDYNARMVEIVDDYQPRGYQFLGINSNKQEGTDEIVGHARENGFVFPVLKDDRNVIADRFGATRTPEVYVLSKAGVVLYHGRIDDSRDADDVSSRDLAAALDAIRAGEPVPVAETTAFGCSIKRVR
jgi:peroxiredoxin